MNKTVAYNIDCMEYMATLPDKAFQLAIVDPPYFKGVGATDFYGSKISSTGVSRGYNEIKCWDNEIPGQDYFSELVRVSANQVVWGINYYPNYLVGSGRIVWDKKNDSSTFSKCEIAYISNIDSVQIFRYMWNGMLQENMKSKEKRIHPTQKPVKLYEWLLMNYAKEGDKILDTHLGSGSSRIAAHKLGFDFVGCELDKDYFEAQEKRFKIETMQQSLF